MWARLRARAAEAAGLLFYGDGSAASRWLGRAVAVLMWLGGAMVWGFGLSWGKIGFAVHDWTQEGPRFDFLRRALLEGRLPLHIGTPLASTTRFLAIPDTLISRIVVPMVTLTVLGGSSLERWLQARRAHPAVWLLLAGVAAHDLLQHARLWRLENMWRLFPVTPVDIRAEVLTIADGPYEASLMIGGVVSLMALAALVGLAMRERHLARGAHRA